jgi:hypothetical protein
MKIINVQTIPVLVEVLGCFSNSRYIGLLKISNVERKEEERQSLKMEGMNNGNCQGLNKRICLSG